MGRNNKVMRTLVALFAFRFVVADAFVCRSEGYHCDYDTEVYCQCRWYQEYAGQDCTTFCNSYDGRRRRYSSRRRYYYRRFTDEKASVAISVQQQASADALPTQQSQQSKTSSGSRESNNTEMQARRYCSTMCFDRYRSVKRCWEKFRYRCAIMGSDGRKCKASKGTCNTADTVCGTRWTGVDLRNTSCKNDNTVLPSTWLSWKDLMDSSTMTRNSLTVVDSDKLWFNDALTLVLFNTSVNMTMPNSMKAIQESANYDRFTCMRNLPQCMNDMPHWSVCEIECQRISARMGEFERQCALEKAKLPACNAAYERTVAALLNSTTNSTNNSNNTNTTNGSVVLPPNTCGNFTCGSVRDTCIYPWCTISALGTGQDELGWTRECRYMCQEYQRGISISGAQVLNPRYTFILAVWALLLAVRIP